MARYGELVLRVDDWQVRSVKSVYSFGDEAWAWLLEHPMVWDYSYGNEWLTFDDVQTAIEFKLRFVG